MTVLLPSAGIATALLPFAAVAAAMVGVTIFVIGAVVLPDRRPPLVTQMLLALSVLLGGTVLLLALLFVFLDPNGSTAWTWVLLAFNFMMMVPVGLWFVTLVIFRERRVSPGGWGWPLAIGAATTGSEMLMGLLFAVGGATGSLSPLRAVALGLSSVWFFWSMAAVMTALLVWAPLSGAARGASVGIAIAGFMGPWVAEYPLLGGVSMTVLMGGVFGVLVSEVARRRVARGDAGVLVGFSIAFLGMGLAGAGLAGGSGSDPATVLFGAVMAAVMVGEVGYLVRRQYSSPTESPDGRRSPEGVPGRESSLPPARTVVGPWP